MAEVEFIYALYFGKFVDLFFYEGELSKEIFVFDYSGNLAKTCSLNHSLQEVLELFSEMDFVRAHIEELFRSVRVLSVK